MIVSREISFRAFHSHHGMMYEPNHPHEVYVTVAMQGQLNEEGFICDFRAVKRMFKKIVVAQLENKNLDDIFEFPTSENLAVWVWNELEKFFPLHSIEVREKPHSKAIYFGPNSRE